MCIFAICTTIPDGADIVAPFQYGGFANMFSLTLSLSDV
jgi:hypothetical protein